MMTNEEWAQFDELYRRPPTQHKGVALELLEHQNYRCGICGEALARTEFLTLDHVIPKVLGGADAVGNLVTAHEPCNNRKSGRKPTGCELIWLLSVNNRMQINPLRW